MSQQINLLNSAYRKKAFSFTSARAMAYALGIAVSLTTVIAIIQGYRLRAIEADAAQVARLFKQTTAAQASAAAEIAPKPDPALEVKIRALEAQLKSRQDIIDAMKNGLVGSSDGFSEYMRVFSRQSLEGVWLTGFDVAVGGDELAIAGRALSADLVPAYLQRLNRETSVQGRQFTSMLISQPKVAPADEAAVSYVEFRVASGSGEENRVAVSPHRAHPAIQHAARSDDPAQALKGRR